MRIRSIRPEFWTSLDITKHDYFDRLLFIGLWSYVDDNGVGLDRVPVIIGELFPDDMSRDPRDTFARVADGLQRLADGGQITRYTHDGRDLIYVPAWDTHQRVDRPGKSRYPRPTSGNTTDRESVATPSREDRDTPSTGEGEKGRRGEGEKGRGDARASARSTPRGARIPDGFPTPDLTDWARTERPDLDADAVATDFRDYWVAQPGAKARKTDWAATWRRWVRNQNPRGHSQSDHRSPSQRHRDRQAALWRARSEAEHQAGNARLPQIGA